MFPFPELSASVGESQARGQYPLRYEDVAQSGMIKLTGLPPAIGVACFRPLWRQHPINVHLSQRGVLPILTGLVVEAIDGPISVSELLEAEGRYQLAHDVDERGDVARVFLNMTASVYGPRGLTHGKQPPGAGERILVGRVFSEHVFTRPFAKADRKVLSLDVPGVSPVPAERYRWKDARTLLELPAGAEPLCELSPEPSLVAFGMVHTDSNQHVNSVAYPALFEQAVVRRAASLGVHNAGLGRFVELAYRKPCFAGDQMQLHLQLFRHQDQLGAVGALTPPDAPLDRPHCTMRMTLG